MFGHSFIGLISQFDRKPEKIFHFFGLRKIDTSGKNRKHAVFLGIESSEKPSLPEVRHVFREYRDAASGSSVEIVDYLSRSVLPESEGQDESEVRE